MHFFKQKSGICLFNNLIIAAKGYHALYTHNRRFYWNSIEGYFEPIYYDGEFNLKKIQKKLNFPISESYKDSLKELRLLILKLNLENTWEKGSILKCLIWT